MFRLGLSRLFLNAVGSVIAAIGWLTLPEGFDDAWARLRNTAESFAENPLSGGAVIVGLALLTIVNWNWLREHFWPRPVVIAPRWASDKELGDEIYGWLRQRRYALEEVLPIQPSPKLAFGFRAERDNRNIVIAKEELSPTVGVSARIVPSGDHRGVITKMTNNQRHAMFEDIALELAKTGVAFRASGKDILDRGVVVSVGFTPTETMSQEDFLSVVGLITAATMIVVVLVQRHCRQADPSLADNEILDTEAPVALLEEPQDET